LSSVLFLQSYTRHTKAPKQKYLASKLVVSTSVEQ
jgi:hypothetical protein